MRSLNRYLCASALSICVAAAAASAEELDAAIGQDDSRFTIETDSIQIYKDEAAGATGYHYQIKERVKYAAVVDGCRKGYGSVTLLLDDSGKGSTYPWRANGPKVYDLISKLICTTAFGS